MGIQLANPAPKWRFECGCCDCRQALQWATLQGGPPCPVVPDLWYFDNDLTIVSGEDSMSWYKLREEGQSIRLVANCCHSTMAVHHPAYNNNVVMVMSSGVNMDVGDIEVAARGQMKDFPRGRIGELKPFKGKPVDKDNLDVLGEGESPEEFFAGVMAIFGAKLENRKGKSTQELIDSASQVTYLGLKEYDELL